MEPNCKVVLTSKDLLALNFKWMDNFAFAMEMIVIRKHVILPDVIVSTLIPTRVSNLPTNLPQNNPPLPYKPPQLLLLADQSFTHRFIFSL